MRFPTDTVTIKVKFHSGPKTTYILPTHALAEFMEDYDKLYTADVRKITIRSNHGK